MVVCYKFVLVGGTCWHGNRNGLSSTTRIRCRQARLLRRWTQTVLWSQLVSLCQLVKLHVNQFQYQIAPDFVALHVRGYHNLSLPVKMHFRLTGLSKGFNTFTGTHLSLFRYATVLPTITDLGLDLEPVGSITTAKTTSPLLISCSLPQTRCSVGGSNVTALFSLTAPI